MDSQAARPQPGGTQSSRADREQVCGTQTESFGRVSTAVERIHDAQGELQEATIEHVFEMKGVLTPEQYQKLLNLTADELNEVNGGE